MRKIIAIPIVTVLFLLIVGTAFYFISQKIINSYNPIVNGKEEISGLSDDAEIYRDSLGVPYIFADNLGDAFFTLGYVHAQERMFQMDISRRAGQGRLSEVLGEETVAFDKMFRTIGIHKFAEENYGKLSPETKLALNSYADGVNAYIEKSAGKISAEFDILDYTPEKWEPVHSLIIARMLAWELNISWWSDITYAHLLKKVGAKKTTRIIPDDGKRMPAVVSQLKDSPKKLSDFLETAKAFRKFTGIEGSQIGSNNWAVSSKRSSSGRAIIANDPHLPLGIPGKWFFADIHTEGYNVSGFTIPGVPGVIIGKNNKIAWTITNVMADDADFYSETLDSTKSRYLLDGEWKKLSKRKELIKIKNKGEAELTVYSTHRGPVISGIHPYKKIFPLSEQAGTTISMRWTALDFSDEIKAIINLNKAGNRSEVENALAGFAVPGQNFVWADISGNIGYVCAAKIPVRKELSGIYIYDGTKAFSDWTGFVPYSEMPKSYNPAENFLASANNRISENFPYHISNIWEPPSRINRIKSLLASKGKHGVSDFIKYQNDIYSDHAAEICGYLFNAFDSVRTKTKKEQEVLYHLKKWDYTMDKGLQAPAVFSVFFGHLLKNTYQDEMGKNLFREFSFMASIPIRSMSRLLAEKDTVWFDDIRTPAKETRNEILRKSFSDAVLFLEKEYGKEIAFWQWGNLHTITLKHLFSGKFSSADKIINSKIKAISGSGTTIMNTEYLFTEPYETRIGQSMRFIYDFSAPDQVIFILPAGQSGHITSDNYTDMYEKWIEGGYVKISTNPEIIRKANFDKLILHTRKN